MKHTSSVGGAFDFGDNFRAYRELGSQIIWKATAIRNRSLNGDHEVGNGNFIRLEDLRHKQRQALLKILEGIGIIVAIAGATVIGVSSLEGCEGSAPQDEVSSVRDTISLRFNEEGLK